jgi:hypothetical protein
MQRIRPVFMTLQAMVACAILFGCASKQPPTNQTAVEKPPQEPPSSIRLSGFLDPQPDFRAGTQGIDLVYVREGVDLASYDKVLLDPLVFLVLDDPKYKGAKAEKLKELSEAYRAAMAKELGKDYPLVTEPGPGVMRVRTAITNLVSNKPGLIAAMAIIPGGSLAYAALPAKYNNIGSATMEGEALDSVTGERIAAAAAHRSGKKTEFFSGLSKWGHVKKALDVWAHLFRQWLDQNHGKVPPGTSPGAPNPPA